MIISRRAWLGAASVVGAAGLFETLTLAGTFDHRNAARVAADSMWRSTFIRMERLGQYVNGVGCVGHCTYVMVIKGVRVLTDPWFFDPAFGLLEHSHGPAALPEDIGPLDAIAISHAHPDHFDRSALDRLDKSAKVLVATESMARTVQRLGYSDVKVLKPWQAVDLGKATLTAVPAVSDVTQNGYVLHSEVGKDGIYFAGDTAMSDAMNEIRVRLQPKLALLPIDGAHRLFSPHHSMNPEEALQATRMLEVHRVVPCHDGAQFVTGLGSNWLAKRLYQRVPDASAAFAARVRKELSNVMCVLPKTGDFVRV